MHGKLEQVAWPGLATQASESLCTVPNLAQHLLNLTQPGSGGVRETERWIEEGRERGREVGSEQDRWQGGVAVAASWRQSSGVEVAAQVANWTFFLFFIAFFAIFAAVFISFHLISAI